MLSPTAAWVAAFARSTVEPVVLMTINVDFSTDLWAAYGYSPTIAGQFPPSIEKVTPVAASLDPVRRTISVGSWSVVLCADGLAKSWHTNYRLKGKMVTLRYGERSLAYGDYLTVLVGQIDEAKARWDGGLELTISDRFGKLRDADVAGLWENLHPLEVMTDIFTRAGLASYEYTASSFDPSQAAHAAYSHLTIEKAVWTKEKAMGLVEQLACILGGCVRASETGVLEYVPWNPTQTPAFSFGDNDFLEGSFEIIGQGAHAYNRAVITWDEFNTQADKIETTGYRKDETTSQTALKEYGGVKRVLAFESSYSMLGSSLWCHTSFSAAAGAGTTVLFEAMGMAGVNWTGFPVGSQPSWAQASTSKTVLVQFYGEFALAPEIIEFDQVTVDATQVTSYEFKDPLTGASVTHKNPKFVTARIKTRGWGGTPVQAHNGSPNYKRCRDFTNAQGMAARILGRCSLGLGVVRFRTNMSAIAPQLGDFVYLLTSRYFDYGQALSDTSIRWEVIGKEPTFTGSEIGIQWTLATVPQPTQTTVDVAPQPPHDLGDTTGIIRSRLFQCSVEGLAVTAGTGLEVAMSGCLVTVGSWSKFVGGQAIALKASRDHYIVFDGVTSLSWLVVDVANGAGAPTFGLSQPLVAKVVTNATIPTTITQYDQSNGGYVSGSINGGSLMGRTLPGGALELGAVGNSEVGSGIHGSKLTTRTVGAYQMNPNVAARNLNLNGALLP